MYGVSMMGIRFANDPIRCKSVEAEPDILHRGSLRVLFKEIGNYHIMYLNQGVRVSTTNRGYFGNRLRCVQAADPKAHCLPPEGFKWYANSILGFRVSGL